MVNDTGADWLCTPPAPAPPKVEAAPAGGVPLIPEENGVALPPGLIPPAPVRAGGNRGDVSELAPPLGVRPGCTPPGMTDGGTPRSGVAEGFVLGVVRKFGAPAPGRRGARRWGRAAFGAAPGAGRVPGAGAAPLSVPPIRFARFVARWRRGAKRGTCAVRGRGRSVGGIRGIRGIRSPAIPKMRDGGDE